MLVALHLVFGQAHDSGIRSIGWFLELSQLDRFIAPSYGSQQKVASQVEQLIGRFGQEEDKRLGQQMPRKNISLCEDETFHPQICLVAIEPVSNFLILEAYAQVSKATSLALNRQDEKAKEEYEAAKLAHQENLAKRTAFEERWPNSVRELVIEKELLEAAPKLEKVFQETKERFETTTHRKQRARDARCGISKDYHPFDLSTGVPLESSEVQNRLEGHFRTLHAIVDEAKLSQGADNRIAKAERVLPSMIATIAFFWATLKLFVDRLECSEEVAQIWKNELVASYYIARVAGRCQKADESKRLMDLSTSIIARARSPDRPFGKLPELIRMAMEQQAQQAADVFQRSSSCVEGRNGQLSLRHHGLRELTASKLRALRTIHNYVIRRPDGTTAAERFFENQPRDLFGWLLEKLPMPARPRQKRTQKT